MNNTSHIRSSRALPSKALLVAAAGLIACSVLSVRANELVNANLDVVALGPQNLATPTGWAINAYKNVSGAHFDAASSETWANVFDFGGYGLFFKPFQGTVGDEINVHFYQDVAGSPGGKYTLAGYAAADANFSGLFATNNPPPKVLFVVEFLDAGNNVIASNGVDLVAAGLPSNGPSSMQLLTTDTYTAPAGTSKVRAGVFMANAYGTSGGQGFFVDSFDLQYEAPPGAPQITTQPLNTTVSPGGTATFTVQVANPTGVNYQWQFFGTNIDNVSGYSGTKTPTLTVANASAAHVGRYRVRVENTSGGATATSTEAALALTSINFYPVITITGQVNDTYRIDYATRLNPTTWLPLSTNRLSKPTEMFIDATSPMDSTKFYRAVLVAP